MKRVGVIGGGQLAWMMGLAAQKLGIELLVQTPQPTDPAVRTAAAAVLASIADSTATARLAARCDRITFENEFIDLEALTALEQQGVCFRPRLSALAPLLDKYRQRCYLQALGLPTPRFAATEEGTNVAAAMALLQHAELDFPLVLKTRRHGYDGQGTVILKNKAMLHHAWQQLGAQPLLIEEFVPFERELAAIAARAATGEIALYPIVETQQEDQICRRVLVPATVNSAITSQIEAIIRSLLENLDVVGLFGVELFLTATGKVLVNEIAPRTHNSGHFSLDACQTSQFEQHLRAVCDLPLGNPKLCCQGAVMVNLLGYEQTTSDYLDKRGQLAQVPHAFVHWYGKTESRPGRKLGHVTVVQPGPGPLSPRDQALADARQIESIWYNQV